MAGQNTAGPEGQHRNGATPAAEASQQYELIPEIRHCRTLCFLAIRKLGQDELITVRARTAVQPKPTRPTSSLPLGVNLTRKDADIGLNSVQRRFRARVESAVNEQRAQPSHRQSPTKLAALLFEISAAADAPPIDKASAKRQVLGEWRGIPVYLVATATDLEPHQVRKWRRLARKDPELGIEPLFEPGDPKGTTRDRILALAHTGMRPAEIARQVGKSAQAVDKVLGER